MTCNEQMEEEGKECQSLILDALATMWTATSGIARVKAIILIIPQFLLIANHHAINNGTHHAIYHAINNALTHHATEVCLIGCLGNSWSHICFLGDVPFSLWRFVALRESIRAHTRMLTDALGPLSRGVEG